MLEDGSVCIGGHRPPLQEGHNYLDDRAGEVADQIPNPVTGVEEGRPQGVHEKKDGGHHDGKDGPGRDVSLVVGGGLVAHGMKVKGKTGER